MLIAAGTTLVIAASAVAVVGYLRKETRCTGASVTLSVVAAPTSAAVLDELAHGWNAAGRSVDGQCTAVAVRSMQSHVVSASLGASWDEQRDGPRPDVWAPDASTWLLVAAGRPDAAALLPTRPSPSLATSPVVLAMQRPMAEALGWPDKPIGWADLVGGFANGVTWAKFGHPEWGALRLGAADPTHSIAGLAGILSTLDGNNDNALSDQELLGGVVFAQLVSSYAPDTETLFRSFSGEGSVDPTKSLPAGFPVLERDLAAYADGSPVVTLVPVYPREGSAVADFPYAVLRAPWVDQVKQHLAQEFLGYAGQPDALRAFAAAGFRHPDRAANSALLTSDRGFLAVIPTERRAPTADGLGALLGAWALLQRATNLLIALDTSGSMNQVVPNAAATRLQLLQRAAIQGIALLTNHTVVNLWQFSSKLTPTADYRPLLPPGPAGEPLGQVTRRQAMIGAIQQLTAVGATGLYDTVDAAYQQMRRTWQPNAQNVMVIITDGRNEDSEGLSLPQLLQRLKASVRPDQPVQFVGIAVGPEADADALNAIAEATGGRTFVARDEVAAVQQIVLAFAGRLSP